MDNYNDGKPNDYTEIIRDSVFIGEFPFESIKSGLIAQFEDYINMEDYTDYVDVFYTQYSDSVSAVTIESEYPDDKLEVLENIKDEFVDTITGLFSQRLAITISVVDNAETDEDELEIALRRLYEFFILRGREYLKFVISKSIADSIQYVIEDDSQFLNVVEDMLTQYSPIIVGISPLAFIKLVNTMYDASDVEELFETGQISGNFLRKFSPKLYKNKELECEIISDITLYNEWNKEEHTMEENVQFSSFIMNT